jgi:uncharacterized protein (DUF58 family)
VEKFLFIHDLFDKWLVSNPEGLPYQPLPWEAEAFSGPDKRPFHLIPYRVPVAYLFWMLLLAGLAGLIFKLPLCAAIGSGGVTVIVLATRDSWRQSGILNIPKQTYQFSGVEYTNFALTLPIKNRSNRDLHHASLFLKFPGTVEQHHVIFLPKLLAGQDANITTKWPLNAGMGSFAITEILVVTADLLGLIPHCISCPVDIRVDVRPEHAIMPPLRVTVAGKTAHSGSVEARMIGDSTSFLGLRHYREGDNIRRIDWRKSERFQDIIVREFERLDATDATILMDQRAVGAFQYRGLSSYEYLKDTVVTLCRTLMDQRLRVRLITPQHVTEFGKGLAFMDHLMDVISNLEPVTTEPFEQFVAEHRSLIPPYSLVIPVFSAIQIDPNALLDSFWVWNDLRTQILPVAIDTNRFGEKIASAASGSSSKHESLDLLQQLYGHLSAPENYGIARKVSENTIVIGPGESIGDVYARSLSWRV